MNQILQTRLNNKKVKYKKILRFQLFLSVILLFFTSCYLIYNLIISYRQEKYSKRILDSYNITKLYSNSSLSNSDTTNKKLNVKFYNKETTYQYNEKNVIIKEQAEKIDRLEHQLNKTEINGIIESK